MEKYDDITRRSVNCIKSIKDLSMIKMKAQESKKIDIRKRYQSKSPIRSKKEPLQTNPDINFDASEISDIEKLIMSEKKRNKSARKSLNRVANELNDFYITNDQFSHSNKQKNIVSSGYTTEFYIQYAQELEKQYDDIEKKNEELEKEVLSYFELEENYNRLKIELIKYNYFKSIAKEFNKKEENSKQINNLSSKYQSNKNSIYSLYGTNKSVSPLQKSSYDTNKKISNINLKLEHPTDLNPSNLYLCENNKCLENKKLYEELKKLTIKLKLENESWKKKCIDLGGDNITIKDIQNSKERSILNK